MQGARVNNVRHRLLVALLLGADGGGRRTWLGGLLIVRRQWSRHYLKYFIALGAGFMLATAMLEMIPESVKLREDSSSLFFDEHQHGFHVRARRIFSRALFRAHGRAALPFRRRNAPRGNFARARELRGAARPGDPHFFRRRGDCFRSAGFDLARRRDFHRDLSAQNSRGIYGVVADAGERAEPQSGAASSAILGGDDARWAWR